MSVIKPNDIFGRLTAIKIDSVRRYGKTKRYIWECLCKCGRKKNVSDCHLKSGHTTSCGCFRNEKTSQRMFKHGHRIIRKGTPIYQTWARMIQRCTNPNTNDWKWYGGRGISVDPIWLDFSVFLKEMGPTWKQGLTIDRKDPNSNYGPGLCRWATRYEQVHNRRNSHGMLRKTRPA